MAPKKGLAGKDSFARMNFLYQAATLCSSFSSGKSQDVAAYYGLVFRNVAKKALLRAEPEIKRKFCKGCHRLLIPGDNVKIRLQNRPTACLVWTCQRCLTIKRFGVRKNYKIWQEHDEAVLETTTFSNKTADVEKEHSVIDMKTGSVIDMKTGETGDNKGSKPESHTQKPIEKQLI